MQKLSSSNELATTKVQSSAMTDSSRDRFFHDPIDGHSGSVSMILVSGEQDTELSISMKQVFFNGWENTTKAEELEQSLSIKLDSLEADDEKINSSASIPVIIAGPKSTRFSLKGHIASTHSLLLKVGQNCCYSVSFTPPALTDSDFAFDNFQDQIAVHTREGSVIIYLKATKKCVKMSQYSAMEYCPRALPLVQPPSLHNFDMIEKQERLDNAVDRLPVGSDDRNLVLDKHIQNPNSVNSLTVLRSNLDAKKAIVMLRAQYGTTQAPRKSKRKPPSDENDPLPSKGVEMIETFNSVLAAAMKDVDQQRAIAQESLKLNHSNVRAERTTSSKDFLVTGDRSEASLVSIIPPPKSSTRKKRGLPRKPPSLSPLSTRSSIMQTSNQEKFVEHHLCGTWRPGSREAYRVQERIRSGNASMDTFHEHEKESDDSDVEVDPFPHELDQLGSGVAALESSMYE